jgi:nitrite reductase (NADH) small subunit/3-phenylpropionate/trans-cinnamate dioxygenase ferredoxin subunit
VGEYVKVGRVEDFREGRGAVVRVEGKRVAVFKVGDQLHAMQDNCPHMGASLADGRLQEGRVVCHWHGWTFDLVSGQGDRQSKKWLCAKVYALKVEGGDVYVERPEGPAPRRAPEDDESWPF